jgi:hypothetical protein
VCEKQTKLWKFRTSLRLRSFFYPQALVQTRPHKSVHGASGFSGRLGPNCIPRLVEYLKEPSWRCSGGVGCNVALQSFIPLVCTSDLRLATWQAHHHLIKAFKQECGRFKYAFACWSLHLLQLLRASTTYFVMRLTRRLRGFRAQSFWVILCTISEKRSKGQDAMNSLKKVFFIHLSNNAQLQKVWGKSSLFLDDFENEIGVHFLSRWGPLLNNSHPSRAYNSALEHQKVGRGPRRDWKQNAKENFPRSCPQALEMSNWPIGQS